MLVAVGLLLLLEQVGVLLLLLLVEAQATLRHVGQEGEVLEGEEGEHGPHAVGLHTGGGVGEGEGGPAFC